MSQLVGKGSKDRWYPNSIQSLNEYLESCKYLENDNSGLVSNLAYNLQYVEYLRKTLNELNLSTVLKTQTIKSFIITSLSIIESILIAILDVKRNSHFHKVIEDFAKIGDCPYSSSDINSLNDLRILRNHIHLNKTKDIDETDYKLFWIPEYNCSKKLLYKILTSKYFDNNLDLFVFLKTNNAE